jgi:type I restriction enzyme M protein
MARLSLAKLEYHLYSAADRLCQEGLDAATYKDYIFGMLFLKRCSDVFDAEHERIISRKIAQGMSETDAQAAYGENHYDSFFVPERARWAYLEDRLNDAKESYGGVLDKALGALSEANETLEHVLDHIQFLRTQGNKRIVSDDACKDWSVISASTGCEMRISSSPTCSERPTSSSSTCSPSRPARKAAISTRRAT